MQFQESIKTCFNKFIDFKGRASRSEYWWFVLFAILVNIAANLLLPSSVGTIIVLVLMVPQICAAIRRLHDMGKSGFWLFLCLIPIVGLIVIYWLIQKSVPTANEYGNVPTDLEIIEIPK